VLVALKCDLREAQDDEDDDPHEPKAPMVEYKQGLEAAKNIKALRYLGALPTRRRRPLLTADRVLGDEESRRQGGLYRGNTRRARGQERLGQALHLLHHVDLTPAARLSACSVWVASASVWSDTH
jgi:hypothetical protein